MTWTWNTNADGEVYVNRGDGLGFIRPTLDPKLPGVNDRIARVVSWAPLAAEIGEPNGSPLHWTLGVIYAESAGNPNAVSPVGARGLMQIMPATAKGLGYDPESMFQPAPNIGAGTTLLGDFRSKKFDFPAALSMYNAGPAVPMRPKKSLKSPWGYVENDGYITTATSAANYFRREFRHPDPIPKNNVVRAGGSIFIPILIAGFAYLALGGKTFK